MTATQLPLWVPEPCHDAAPAPQQTRAQRLVHDHRVTSDLGRAPGGGRHWTPIGETVTTIHPPQEYL